MSTTGMECLDCGVAHPFWNDAGSYTVSGPYHAGVVERWECDICGDIVEGGRR